MLKDNQRFNESIKPNSVFLAELSQKLPEFFTAKKYDDEGNIVEEAKFDMEKFQRALKEQNVDELSSGYQIDFIGKNYAKKQAGERSTTVIVPDNEHNEKPENKDSKNLFFTGDNLEVLRHLQQNYANSVDFIYIDPPYNTGSDGFVYPDSFEYTDEQLKNMFGLNDDELKRLKSIQGKSTHSAWLAFMYPRLYLAKKLLKDSGVIFVSIDDNEQADLKLLMDDVFGEGSFITNFVWEKKKKPSFLNINLGTKFEYITVYAKDRGQTQPFSVETTTKGKKYPFNNSGNGIKTLEFPSGSIKFTNMKDGFVKAQDMSSGNIKTNLINNFEIKNGTNIESVMLEGEWRYSQQKLNEIVRNGNLITISSVPFRPNLTMDGGEVKKMHNLLTVDQYQVATNEDATNEFSKLMGANYFDFTKPTGLIKLLLKSCLYNNPNGIVMDFFAGSSTTADAVMQLNAEDGGNRQFMMCTLPEPTYTTNYDGKEMPTKGGEAAFKAGFKSIDEISRERIIRASNKIKSENPLLSDTQDLGFKHYQVVKPNQQALDKIEYDGDMQLDMFDDMITLFSSGKLGVKGNADGYDTILYTYLVNDNYKFDVSIEMREFEGINLPFVNNQRIYVITNDWKADNTKALVNAIGTNEISVQTIVVYGYTMEMESLRELEIALNQLENKVNLLVRY
ncbi:site-specific DNA-methyltransferase [Listeria monocytogenes]|nr:site-specific DNA-methyltransferase [Listeria monocytogenes]EAC3732537.1 site-specific DNA-methyltransferase [Listeria monocytogenes]EAC5165187.1 site-specific DNA-methyltransferase [Listeria monocytogenes]EAC7371404.1 site-specific DNA-methyltransferase [Listeria monocytogenes]EAC9315329.1 site-specific DNA-methyltransferase [Listeria monocytogenes]